MNPSEYIEYDATGLAELVGTGDVTGQELALCALAMVEEKNPRVNAVLEIFEDTQEIVSATPADAPFTGRSLPDQGPGDTGTGSQQ